MGFVVIMLYDIETEQDLGIQVVDGSWVYQDEFLNELDEKGLGWYEYYSG